MYTATLIRRHINQLKEDKPFSIRDFLNYGPRNAVDQVFYRLVKSGQIIRIARGLFIKDTSPIPSILDVAIVKAAAFSKKLVWHGSQVAHQLKLYTNIDTEVEAIYACSGSSSSFRFGNIRIRFVSSSPRKMSLGNSLADLTISALWHLGKTKCSAQLICNSLISFNRDDRQELRKKIKIMPSWLASYFIRSTQRQELTNSFQPFYHWR